MFMKKKTIKAMRLKIDSFDDRAFTRENEYTISIHDWLALRQQLQPSTLDAARTGMVAGSPDST